MCPIIHIGFLSVSAYWLMAVAGLAAAVIYLRVTLRDGRAGYVNGYDLAALLFLAMIAAFIGGKLLNILINLPSVLANLPLYRGDRAALWAKLTGGRSFYGGFILLGLLYWWYIRRYKLPVDDVCSIATPAIALFMAVARLGCFLAGCCYGVPVSWGVVFPVGSPAPAGVALFPSQLAESGLHLALAAALAALSRRLRQKWLVFPLYLALYGAGRFALDFWRGDSVVKPLGLTVSQWICLGLPVAAAALVLLRRRREATA